MECLVCKKSLCVGDNIVRMISADISNLSDSHFVYSEIVDRGECHKQCLSNMLNNKPINVSVEEKVVERTDILSFLDA